MKKIKFVLMSLLTVAVVASCSKNANDDFPQMNNFASNPNLFVGANPGGNVTCDEVATATGCTFDHTSGKIDYYGGVGPFTTGPITWTTDGTYIQWTSTTPVKVAIIVKGGPNANVYSDCGTCSSGSGTLELSAPINPRTGRPYGLSNITFCYSECAPEPKIIAFKSYTTSGWVVTGGGPTNNYFIGCHPFVVGSYPLYLNGDLNTPAGALQIGNLDGDPLMEVKITSTITGMNFTNAFLYVGSATLPCRTDYYDYPDQKLDINVSEVIFDLPF